MGQDQADQDASEPMTPINETQRFSDGILPEDIHSILFNIICMTKQ